MPGHPIMCPRCGESIELTEALARPLIDAARTTFEATAREREEKVARREREVLAKLGAVEQARAGVEQEVEGRLARERQAMEAALKKQAQQQCADEVLRAKQELAAKDAVLADREKKLAEAGRSELLLRQERQRLLEEREQFELLKQRAIDEERARIREGAMKDASEQYRLKAAEKDKLIADMQRRVEELQHKVEQGSQQLQGEVHELDLESLLKSKFPRDLIEPVPKGQFGGDVLQRVVSETGLTCGVLIWECKRTRNWSDSWLAKLRADQRTAKADVAVILTTTLPKGVEAFDRLEDVWVTGSKAVVPLALALRQSLIEVAGARQAGEGQQTKMEVVYQYLVGPRFKQRVSAIVEAFSSMQEDLDKEKKALTRQWAKREEQIERVMQATLGMYGDLQGIAGKSLPEIEGLEFPMLGTSVRGEERRSD